MEDTRLVHVASRKTYVPILITFRVLNVADDHWFYSWVWQECPLVCRTQFNESIAIAYSNVCHLPALQLSKTLRLRERLD